MTYEDKVSYSLRYPIHLRHSFHRTLSMSTLSVELFPGTRSIRNVALSMKNMALSMKNMALSMKNMALSMKNIALSMKNIALSMKNMALSMKNMALSIQNMTLIQWGRTWLWCNVQHGILGSFHEKHGSFSWLVSHVSRTDVCLANYVTIDLNRYVKRDRHQRICQKWAM